MRSVSVTPFTLPASGWAPPLRIPYKSAALGPGRLGPWSFRRSRAVVPVLEVLDEAGSTNDVLERRAGDLPACRCS